MINRIIIFMILFGSFLLVYAKNEHLLEAANDVVSSTISIQQINDYVSLVDKTKGNPNGLIYGGGRELFQQGFVLPNGFEAIFQPFLKETKGNVAFYSFMEIDGDNGSYWARLEVDLVERKVIKYDAMGFNIGSSNE